MKGEVEISGIQLLSPEEAAHILHISTKTLSTWRYLRKGPRPVKVGARVFYEAQELSRYVTAHRADWGDGDAA